MSLLPQIRRLTCCFVAVALPTSTVRAAVLARESEIQRVLPTPSRWRAHHQCPNPKVPLLATRRPRPNRAQSSPAEGPGGRPDGLQRAGERAHAEHGSLRVVQTSVSWHLPRTSRTLAHGDVPYVRNSMAAGQQRDQWPNRIHSCSECRLPAGKYFQLKANSLIT